MSFELTIALHSALLIAGMMMLYYGGSLLVRGAGGIALKLRISPLVVGLTVVAFGTSAPELFVSLLSAAQGKMGISVGNVIGSNVINIALVLGIAAVIRPTVVDRDVVRTDAPIMMATYLLFALTVADVSGGYLWTGGVISRWEGLLMVCSLGAYIIMLYRRSRSSRSPLPIAEEIPEERAQTRSAAWDLVMIGMGAGFLAGGAEVLVEGAGWLAVNVIGAGERFVGIAIVALGTSLPELFTTLVSLSRGEMDLSVGNLVGSNIFNSLMVLGTTAIVLPIRVGATDFSIDFVFMAGTSAILVTVLALRRTASRPMGTVLVATYFGYVAYLVATRTL